MAASFKICEYVKHVCLHSEFIMAIMKNADETADILIRQCFEQANDPLFHDNYL